MTAMDTPRLLQAVTFRSRDLKQFCATSSDNNPLHMDAGYARKTAFGRRVVFGTLGTLYALRALNDPRAIASLDAEYRKPMFLDWKYGIYLVEKTDAGARVELRDGDLVLQTLAVTYGELPAPACGQADILPQLRQQAQQRTSDQLAPGFSLSGSWARQGEPMTHPLQSDLLMLASYLVGMEAPGEKALFSRLQVTFPVQSYDSRPVLDYQFTSTHFDKAFGLLHLQLEVATAGKTLASAKVHSFVREQIPHTQQEDLRQHLGEVSLEGKQALVVGGSRGLGASLTQALALAGCHVWLNFHSSREEAVQLAEALGESRVTLIQGNASDRSFWEQHQDEIARAGGLDLVFLNACAPPVQLPDNDAGKRRAVSYIRRNMELVRSPLESCLPQLKHDAVVAALSSIYAAEACPFPHYARLKQQVETYLEEIAQQRPDLHCVAVRPPVLRTEMSNGPGGNPQALGTELAAAAIVHHCATPQAGFHLMSTFETVGDQPKHQMVLGGTFTLDPLLPSVDYWIKHFQWDIQAQVAPYHQVFQLLLGASPEYLNNEGGMNLCFLRWEDWLRDLDTGHRYATAKPHLEGILDELLRAFDAYAQRSNTDLLIMVCPSSPKYLADGQMADLFKGLEQRLQMHVAGLNQVDLLSAFHFHKHYRVDSDYLDLVRDEMGHMPFKPSYYHVLGTLAVRHFHALNNRAYKVWCADCDNTLWSGVCGEDGAEGVRVERHHKALQEAMIQAQNEGMILTLCSKNVPEDVDAVFANHPHMLLRSQHLVDGRINWQAKSANITELAESLDLGSDSFIFIDDNPVECAEVRHHLPQVMTLQWPTEPAAAERFLKHLWLLDRPRTTGEDRHRTRMYQAENKRKQLLDVAQDYQNFIENLDMQVQIEDATPEQIARVAQLTQRTNQFNFTTIRRSEGDIKALIEAGARILTATVSDRFGSYGLVGVMILTPTAKAWVVDSFMLSCRVLGRGVEHQLLAHAGFLAQEAGVDTVHIPFKTSAKNKPAANFLQQVHAHEPQEEALTLEISAKDLAALRFQAIQTKGSNSKAKGQVTAANAEQYLHVIELADQEALAQAIDGPSLAQNAGVQGALSDWVFGLFSQTLGISIEALDGQASLDTYVKDSFKRVELTVALKQVYPQLPTTFLFEQKCLDQIVKSLGHDSHIQAPQVAHTDSTPTREPIAIIGIAGRFPGAPTVNALWDLLIAGQDAITEVPADRWDVDRYFSETLTPGKTYCRKGGFMEDVDCFDAAFFHISPKEAELMDPQQRLLLETVWNLFEDAAITPATMERNTSVFVGVNAGDYGMMANVAALGGASAYRHADYYQLANRISYFFDLKGPSLTLDTACSSSGTALFLACETLSNGRSDAAVVGGINLFLHPSRFVQYAHMRMISTSGKCSPFGKGADGTIFGEGIGALLLKPLANAEADGDPIHGVIRACSINSGGKTNGFTVPNPRAQADLITQALREADVDPATISYVEAHGTGTPLGDPIEVRGLTLAYREELDRRQQTWEPGFCGIGSLKANIGHLEAGAALPGIIKVLLQMRHQTLVPSLNAAETNPKIDFEGSPFQVQHQLQPWTAPIVDGEIVPLRAGVSSFGAGGSNAHVVLEAPPAREQVSAPDQPNLFCVSARSEDRLKVRASQLADFLARENALHLTDVAYSLQLGREEMEYRLAIVARTTEELQTGLRTAAQGETLSNLWMGRMGEGRHMIESLLDGTEGDAYLQAIYNGRNLGKLATLWLAGIPMAWQRLYTDTQPRRVNLPGYPFQGDRFWLPEDLARAAEDTHPRIHPLLDAIHPGLSLQEGLTFSKTFQPTDRLLRHHRVNGKPTLPGVAYLAMAFAAAHHISSGDRLSLQRVTWQQPFDSDSDDTLLLSVVREEQALAFRFFTAGDEGNVVHCKGKLVGSPAITQEALSLKTLKERCAQQVSRDAIYARFRGMGIDYGTYFRGIHRIFKGNNEVLGELNLPKGYRGELETLTPHPSLADAALQTALFLFDDNGRPAMPFTVSSVSVLATPTQLAYAHAIRQGNEAQISLLDKEGRECLRYQGFCFREGADPHQDFYFVPRWEVAPLPTTAVAQEAKRILIIRPDGDLGLGKAIAAQHMGAQVEYLVLGSVGGLKRGKHRTIATNKPEHLTRALANMQPVDCVYFLGGLCKKVPALDDVEAQMALYRQGTLSFFRFLAHMPQLGKPRLVVVTANTWHGSQQERNPAGAALHALCETVVKEQSRSEVVCVDICTSDLDKDPQRVARLIANEPAEKGAPVMWCRGIRRRAILERTTLAANETPTFREGGTYVILGGHGGIGQVLCRHLASRYGAKLALVGRRAQNPEIETLCTQLQSLGGEARYYQADATQPDELKRCVQNAVSDLGPIQGAVHSAIVLADKTLAKMEEDTFDKAFQVKFAATIALQQALAQQPLDFVLYFSSVNSFTTPPGQGNYSAGCLFKDAYATALTQQGCKAYSLNWGYWGTVGIVATEAYRKRITAQGFGSIAPEQGIEAVERLLASDNVRVAAVKAEGPLLDAMNVQQERQLVQEGEPLLDATIQDLCLPDPDMQHARAQEAGLEKLEHLVAALALGAMQRLGVFRKKSERESRAALAAKLGVIPEYHQLLASMVEMLLRHDLLRGNNEFLALAKDAEKPEVRFYIADPDRASSQLVQEHPQIAERLPLLLQCAKALPEVMVGKRNHMSVVFPNGSIHLVENIYKSNPTTDYFNRTMAALVISAAKTHLANSHTPFRVLEVGAGTGGTAAWVLPALAPFGDRVEYVYTDISSRFTRHGEETYGHHGFTHFSLLDLSKDPEPQGFEPASFQVVLGTNCLHATPRLDQTLWYLKRLLCKGGLLLANEFVTRLDYNTLTFGLTSGWWLFEDGPSRIPYSPLLLADQWEEMFRVLGFPQSNVFHYPDNGAATLGQVVMAAESDGIVSLYQQPSLLAEAVEPEPVHEEPLPVVQPAAQPAPVPQVAAAPPQDLQGQTMDLLKSIFADVLRIQSSRIGEKATFDTLGIDSLISLEIVEGLEKHFGNLSDVLLFEHDTLRKLTEYFVQCHSPKLTEVLGAQQPKPVAAQPLLFQQPTPQPIAPPAEPIQPIAVEPAAEPTPQPQPQPADRAIAIVGMAGRYPGSPDLDSLWENLKEGRSCTGPIPEERWTIDGEHPVNRWGGFLDDVDRFDAPFFNIAPNEAALIDPSERLFLETAWSALEDAGYTGELLSQQQEQQGPIGVFAGAMYQQYPLLAANPDDAERLANNSFWSIANRVSFFFDLKGPSLALDTACSSSLSAMHVAVGHLLDGSCSMAVVGGVNLSLTVGKYQNLQRLGMLGSSEKSRSMGAGDGLTPAEGVGVAILKPLSQAQTDGDPIWGVIRGTAVNHGGRTSGFTVPSPTAHGDVAARALTLADLPIETVNYVDVAANGSALGDPIEITGLTRAFRRFSQASNFCALGSVKSNLGHSEAASGMAQVFKVLLQMRHRQLVPTLHAQPTNPSLRLEGTPFYIQHNSTPWEPVGHAPLRASVNTFGAGGSNAHVVLEAPPTSAHGNNTPELPLLVLSARNEDRLQAYAQRVCDFLQGAQDLDYAGFLYSYQVGRRPLQHRLAIVAHDVKELEEKLTGYLRGHSHLDGVFTGKVSSRAEQDAEDTAYLQTLLQSKKTAKAARLWVSGIDPQWSAMVVQPPARIGGLPGYPFKGERHWVEQGPRQDGTWYVEEEILEEEPIETAPPQSMDATDLKEHLFHATILHIANILGLDAEEIDLAMDMNELGLDSVNLSELTTRLNDEFNLQVTASLFFGYASLGACLTALWEEHREEMYLSGEAPKAPKTTRKVRRVARPKQQAPQVSSPEEMPIAVVGMSGMMPQSEDLDDFWEHLLAGRELVSEIPADRWDWQAIYGDPHKEHNRTRARWGAFLEGIDGFDPFFFGISPGEAELMDPQQRKMLQVAWQTFENAGYAATDMAGSKTGVFVAACNHDYDKLLRENRVSLEPHSATGSMVHPILANRISYLFDLRGPSEIVDTACSSSAVALHRAVCAMRQGECDSALVGGVNLLMHPDGFIMLDKAGILSSDGHVRLYNPESTGYVRGEGVIAVMLKPLAKAQADRDTIYGVIRATATNHDGKSYSMTAPNPTAQEAVINEVFAGSDIDPSTVTYIEAQGTGSPIGDPVEARALRKAYNNLDGSQTERTLGYLKPCVGHLESAYGLTAAVKVLMAMNSGTIPGTPLVNQKEAAQHLTGSGFHVAVENEPWPEPKDPQGQRIPRRGAVHAYGFGGVNAHLLLEEYVG